ncbi:CehA/McbA family metallohydrolase [Roseiconus nitratireducens]|nr:CehA/McbA family metallohydrolase [Roseiconus nitratireducens]
MLSHWEIPQGTLIDGDNELSIESRENGSDDITVGPVRIIHAAPDEWLNQGTIEIDVTDSEEGGPLPCRLTIVDSDGCLVPVGTERRPQIAVRTGVVYTSDGKATLKLPPGRYKVFAGRGFEYSRAEASVALASTDRVDQPLRLRREVDTAGWVACDTHIHTVTHSGHGDATIDERMITIAGEGIELAVATDHNMQIDYRPVARRLGVDSYFTPVIGNEVTTSFGHFNAFPFAVDAPEPDHFENDWNVLVPAILATPDVRVVILNHARDVHRGYRPFGPENFNEATGENLDGRVYRFNAMETLNSGAQQTDPLELFHDWMTLVNHGQQITPVGSSDSHDVNRYIVGQGRTYVRGDDSNPGAVDILQASQSIREGRVSVSAGLFVEATVGGTAGPGETVTVKSPQFAVHYRVDCPSWVTPQRIQLFANGVLLREESLDSSEQRSGTWSIPRPRHDVFLTVLATGPGTRHPSWPMAQPYQPDSSDWTPTNLGFTGPIRMDVDGDGVFSSALDLARSLVSKANGDFAKLVESLGDYDEAVSIQAAGLWQANQGSLLDDSVQRTLNDGAPQTQSGFFEFLSAWRASQRARIEQPSRN